MNATIVTGLNGRGSWPDSGAGGTFTTDGTKRGSWYRSPAPRSDLPMIGLSAARAGRGAEQISIDEYATHRATTALQTHLNAAVKAGLVVDGIWGAKTDTAVKALQVRLEVTADAVVGPVTSKAVWLPILERACAAIDSAHTDTLLLMCRGHIGLESQWDAGAVGRTTPDDLGLGQISGTNHPDLSIDQRLDPEFALPWIARFVDDNLTEMRYDADLAIAAYNLGQGGARSWDKAGRPDVWTRTTTSPGGSKTTLVTQVRRYITLVRAAA